MRNEGGVVIGDRTTMLTTTGYVCIAITLWLIGMVMAGWFPSAAVPGILPGTILALGSILLVIIGILSVVYERHTLDAIVFLSMAGLFFSLHIAGLTGMAATAGAANAGTANAMGTANVSSYYGWFGLVWAIFFCYLWIASLGRKGDTIRMLFLLLFWLGALATALAGFGNSPGFQLLSGYLLLISAILAFVSSAMEVLGVSVPVVETRERVAMST